jgi:hypothetical protein
MGLHGLLRNNNNAGVSILANARMPGEQQRNYRSWVMGLQPREMNIHNNTHETT